MVNLPGNVSSPSGPPDLVLEATKAGRGVLLGIFILLDSVRWLVRRPRLLLLGMVPALLAFALVAGVITVLIFRIRWLVDLLTPFADDWAPALQTATDIVVGAAVIAIVFALCVALFVSLSLALGGPIYQKIWEAVEVSVHGYIPVGASLGQGVRTGLRQAGSFLWRSSKNLIITTAISLIPVVGGIAAIAFSQQLAIWALSFELSGRSFGAHGLSEEDQTKIMKLNRPTTYGFGLATQLSFMIPLGAVLFMPAAIVGSAKLAHTCLAHTNLAESLAADALIEKP